MRLCVETKRLSLCDDIAVGPCHMYYLSPSQIANSVLLLLFATVLRLVDLPDLHVRWPWTQFGGEENRGNPCDVVKHLYTVGRGSLFPSAAILCAD